MYIEKRETRDGSLTCYNSVFDETYHSMSGALGEAEYKHLSPAKEFISSDCFVLDFCFGLGYNAIVAITYAKEKGFPIHVVALENDPLILDHISDLSLPSKYDFAVSLVKDALKTGSAKKDGFSITFYVDDALESILKLSKDTFSVVFFDPFSPKKCPSLWSKDVFTKVYGLMTSPSILTTYSCARMTRDNMSFAGFRLQDGPVVGRVSPGTLGFK